MVTREEKVRLMTGYQEATKKFAESVAELQEKMGRSSKQEYERLRRASEECRVHSEQARLALEQHVAAGKC